MEIASDEIITEVDKERTHKALSELCAIACAALSESESKITARTTFHDAVSAAGKTVAEGICEESVPIAREIVAGMLKDASQYPYVESAVVEAVRPVARSGAYAAIRHWSEGKAMPAAEEAARKVIMDHLHKEGLPILHTAVLAGVRVILENELSNNQQFSEAEKEKLIDDYLSGEATKVASELIAKELTPQLRRQAQKAAELAVEEIAAQATDTIARDEGLDAARVVAIDTAKLEISRLVLAEAQRRAARLARERLQEEAAALDEDKRAEYCQEAARKIAEDAVKSVTEEIADPSVADLDLDKAKELALSAASAVAREFSGAYQMPADSESMHVNTRTLVFLAVQILAGCFIVWFFLLGGYETCEPLFRAVLPVSIYQSIYRSVPHQQQAAPNAKNGVEVDDLLDEQKPSAKDAKTNLEEEVPTANPGGPSPAGSTQGPGTVPAQPGTPSGTSSGTPPATSNPAPSGSAPSATLTQAGSKQTSIPGTGKNSAEVNAPDFPQKK